MKKPLANFLLFFFTSGHFRISELQPPSEKCFNKICLEPQYMHFSFFWGGGRMHYYIHSVTTVFTCNFSDTKNSIASSNISPKMATRLERLQAMQYHNKAGFILLAWSKKKKKKINSRKTLSIWSCSPKVEDSGQGPPCETMHST